MKFKISENNFDLIRLFAASEVAVLHIFSYLSPQIYSHPTPLQDAVIRLLEMFPGVPTFFFISGFLISRSYERVGSLREYARNRSLRIFPALYVCVAVNLLMVWATGYLGANGNYDAMYAVVLTVAFLGFAADRIYLVITKRVLAWRE